MLVFIVILTTASALIAGALWGAYGRMPKTVEGFIIALAGGALIVALMLDMIQPATEVAPLIGVVLAIAAGALTFTGLKHLMNRRFTEENGSGLALAVTLDGIPENLALGTVLIGAAPTEVLSLAAAIFLSNLPEAAGGTKEMTESGLSRHKAVGLWVAVAVLLSLAALAGYLLLDGMPDAALALVRCFAAGAVVASLAITVFPDAFRKDHLLSGIAVATGLILATVLRELGG